MLFEKLKISIHSLVSIFNPPNINFLLNTFNNFEKIAKKE